MSTTPCIKPQETTPDITTARPWRSVCFQVYGADNSRIAHTGMGQLPPHRSTESEANAELIVRAVNSYDENRALIEQLHAKTTCCCGDDIEHSAMEAGHSPVSMYDHALDSANKRIVELEAVLALRGDAQGWRDISTAPKDGREVILQVKMRAGIPGKCLVGHYMPGGHCISDHPPIDQGWYFWNSRYFDKAAEPIAWMPLPDISTLPSTDQATG